MGLGDEPADDRKALGMRGGLLGLAATALELALDGRQAATQCASLLSPAALQQHPFSAQRQRTAVVTVERVKLGKAMQAFERSGGNICGAPGGQRTLLAPDRSIKLLPAAIKLGQAHQRPSEVHQRAGAATGIPDTPGGRQARRFPLTKGRTQLDLLVEAVSVMRRCRSPRRLGQRRHAVERGLALLLGFGIAALVAQMLGVQLVLQGEAHRNRLFLLGPLRQRRHDVEGLFQAFQGFGMLAPVPQRHGQVVQQRASDRQVIAAHRQQQTLPQQVNAGCAVVALVMDRYAHAQGLQLAVDVAAVCEQAIGLAGGFVRRQCLARYRREPARMDQCPAQHRAIAAAPSQRCGALRQFAGRRIVAALIGPLGFFQQSG